MAVKTLKKYTPTFSSKAIIIIIGCLCSIHSMSLAQFNGGQLVSEKFYTEIPFEYVHDKIVIQASMNGIEGRYLFDTGAMCILFKDSAQHGIKPYRQIKIGDATGKKQEAGVVLIASIQIGDLNYKDIPTLNVEMFEGPFKCLGYKGIIGSNLLRFGAFKIDWQSRKMIIADSYQTIGTKNLAESKLSVNKQQSSPHLKVKVNKKAIKWVLLDTGSGDSFSLNNQTAKWLTKKKAIGSPGYQSSGTNSHGAWGAGDYQTKIYNDLNLELGNNVFESVVVETTGGSSKVGMKVLELGDFIIDYPQKRFFFNHTDPAHHLTIDSFGIDFIMQNDQFVVNGVW
ncbi:MAG: retroviral-like aspartic protease family protein, partial [Carboxylicivirga sp.]|nr:retroviral-like aspartic protease family protein [Carboxylicivirga sp.]